MKARIRQYSLLIAFVAMFVPQNLYAHSSKYEHIDDMYEVFGFIRNQKLTDWMEFVSSDMIDKPGDFYEELKEKHPGFTCKHRLLYHWGYNGEAWSDAMESRVRAYGRMCKINQDSIISVFKKELREEQKRRNGIMNRRTEDLFGFSHSGKGASQALFFASIAYDVHLLGDYTPDNTDLDGLQDFNKIVDDIAKRITSIDSQRGGFIATEIKRIARSSMQRANKAESILNYLKRTLPDFIINAEGGALYQPLHNKGFYINSVSAAAAA